MTFAQWAPGAPEPHTWIDPWTPESVAALLRDADTAGWTSYLINADTPAKQLHGNDFGTATNVVGTRSDIDQLLDQLLTGAEARYADYIAGTPRTETPFLLAIGDTAHLDRDPRLATLARFGRATDIHLALDRTMQARLTSIEFRDNIQGLRGTANHP